MDELLICLCTASAVLFNVYLQKIIEDDEGVYIRVQRWAFGYGTVSTKTNFLML